MTSPNLIQAMQHAVNAQRNMVEIMAGDDREARIETAQRQLEQAIAALARIQGSPQDGPVYVVSGDADGWGA